jgi:signal transduction histidine kinase
VPFLLCVGAFYGYLAAEARQEKDRADTAELSTRAKSELIATLTHDVRNNLSAVTGYAEVVLELLPDEASPEVRTLVQRMQVIALEGVQLISNLLDADRLGAGKLSLQRRPLSLAALVKRVAERYEAQAALKGVTLATVLPTELPTIEGDELHLDRVFANLLSNAVKFTPSGGRVEIGAGATDTTVDVEVSDSGPGIAPEDRERVFQMYRQTAAGATLGGSGLGLYVVRSLVEAHGGAVSVGARGGGALFRVTLPLPERALLREPVPRPVAA